MIARRQFFCGSGYSEPPLHFLERCISIEFPSECCFYIEVSAIKRYKSSAAAREEILSQLVANWLHHKSNHKLEKNDVSMYSIRCSNLSKAISFTKLD